MDQGSAIMVHLRYLHTRGSRREGWPRPAAVARWFGLRASSFVPIMRLHLHQALDLGPQNQGPRLRAHKRCAASSNLYICIIVVLMQYVTGDRRPFTFYSLLFRVASQLRHAHVSVEHRRATIHRCSLWLHASHAQPAPVARRTKPASGTLHIFLQEDPQPGASWAVGLSSRPPRLELEFCNLALQGACDQGPPRLVHAQGAVRAMHA